MSKGTYIFIAVIGLVVLAFVIFGKKLAGKMTNQPADTTTGTGTGNADLYTSYLGANKLPGESSQDFILRRMNEGWKF